MAQKAYRESKNFIGLPFNRVPFESFPRLVQKPIAPGLTSQVVEKLLA